MECCTAKAADGRTLAWRQYGCADGFPVIFLHGCLNSRLFQPAWERTDELTAAAGARVLALDRPGYGQSDLPESRSYTDMGADLEAVADAAGVGRFAVVGYSSGGPHALAAAAAVSGERVACVGLLSSDAPYKALLPDLLGKMCGTADITPAAAKERAAASHQMLVKAYSGMRKEDRRAVAEADLSEAARQDCGGPALDVRMESTDWGFDLASVTQPVLLWHGEDDDDVPVAAGRALSQHLPECRAEFVAGENHTMLRRHWGAVLSAVVAASGRGE
eukprot:TRINITY_DN17176_c0_g1_i2.p2 TRINITY_DN17176_c0_g1~~TRINITY_DN17176_c0_g1_i2.p2  ORF type:complete len:288 (+),score=99.11 TRINITY_DN17176_c0_g1_i2:39-866(+)